MSTARRHIFSIKIEKCKYLENTLGTMIGTRKIKSCENPNISFVLGRIEHDEYFSSEKQYDLIKGFRMSPWQRFLQMQKANSQLEILEQKSRKDILIEREEIKNMQENGVESVFGECTSSYCSLFRRRYPEIRFGIEKKFGRVIAEHIKYNGCLSADGRDRKSVV